MKKAIKITQQNIDNNKHLFKGKNVNDIIIYTDKNFPKVFNNGTVNFNAYLSDFLKVIEPTLNENKQIDYNLNNGIIDTELGTFTYAVLDIPEPTAEELQAIKKQERNQKLTDGIIVNNIWFNEDKLTQFTVMAQMVSSMGQPSFEWGFEDGFAQITVQDAFNTVMSASAQFQQIYKDYA